MLNALALVLLALVALWALCALLLPAGLLAWARSGTSADLAKADFSTFKKNITVCLFVKSAQKCLTKRFIAECTALTLVHKCICGTQGLKLLDLIIVISFKLNKVLCL